MAKVFTTSPGAVMEIGHYGPASNDSPAIVPDDVAAELVGRSDLRVERAVAEAVVAPVVGRPFSRKDVE